MASAYGYIKQADEIVQPYNTDFLLQTITYKQQQYDTNQARINEAVANVANLDLMKEQDKAYLSSRLGAIIGGINGAGAQDLSSSATTQRILYSINQAIDNNVLQAVDSTIRARKVMSDIETAKEANDGSYSVVNDVYSQQAIKQWLETDTITTANTRFQAIPYIKYRDVNGNIDKKLKEWMDLRGDTEVQFPDPNNPQYMVSRKVKNLNDQELRQFVYTQLTPEDRKQLEINGWYRYGNTPDEALVGELGRYSNGKLKAYRTELEDKKKLLTALSGDKLDQTQREIADLQLSIDAFSDNISSMRDAATIKSFLTTENLIEGMVYKYSRNPESFKYSKNDTYFAAASQNLNEEKFKWEMLNDNRDYDLNVKKYELDKWKAEKDAALKAAGLSGATGAGGESGVTFNYDVGNELDNIEDLKSDAVQSVIDTGNVSKRTLTEIYDGLSSEDKQWFDDKADVIYNNAKQNPNSTPISYDEAKMMAMDEFLSDPLSANYTNYSGDENNISDKFLQYKRERTAQLNSEYVYESGMSEYFKNNSINYDKLYDNGQDLTFGSDNFYIGGTTFSKWLSSNGINNKADFLKRIETDTDFKKEVNKSAIGLGMVATLSNNSFRNKNQGDLSFSDIQNPGWKIEKDIRTGDVLLRSVWGGTEEQLSLIKGKLSPLVQQMNDLTGTKLTPDDIIQQTTVDGKLAYKITSSDPTINRLFQEYFAPVSQPFASSDNNFRGVRQRRDSGSKGIFSAVTTYENMSPDAQVFKYIYGRLPQNISYTIPTNHIDFQKLGSFLEKPGSTFDSKKPVRINRTKDGLGLQIQQFDYKTKGKDTQGVTYASTIPIEVVRGNGLLENFDLEGSQMRVTDMKDFKPSTFKVNSFADNDNAYINSMMDIAQSKSSMYITPEKVDMSTKIGAMRHYLNIPTLATTDQQTGNIVFNGLGNEVMKVINDPSKIEIRNKAINGILHLEVRDATVKDRPVLGTINTNSKDARRLYQYNELPWTAVTDVLDILSQRSPTPQSDPLLNKILNLYR